MGDFLGKWLNVNLLSQPMNWAIVWLVATIWLLLYHVLMQAFTAMQGSTPVAFSGPGQIAQAVPSTGAFSIMGSGDGSTAAFVGGATTIWTDGFESRYAEDGWTGNG